jgi:hypothetical protein
MNKLKEVFYMLEYIIHFLIRAILILVLANIALAFVPRTIRKTIVGTFKLAYKVTRIVTTQSIKIVKKTYANHKEIEQPKKRKYSPRKKNTNSKTNVIQFPKANVK